MRKIKFRAWDKKDKEMYHNIQKGIKFSDLSHYTFNEFLGFPEGMGDYHKYEVMQFTGLHDKNKKEIYEGDIVKGDWSVINDISIGEVMFYGGAFRFKPAGQPLEFAHYRKECEVVGNIYENPEILK